MPIAKAEEERKGDPQKITKVVEPDSIGPDGSYYRGNPNNFAAVGKESDILEALRQKGWSEDAIAALKSGKTIVRQKLRPDPAKPGEEIILGEDWKDKKEGEGH